MKETLGWYDRFVIGRKQHEIWDLRQEIAFLRGNVIELVEALRRIADDDSAGDAQQLALSVLSQRGGPGR